MMTKTTANQLKQLQINLESIETTANTPKINTWTLNYPRNAQNQSKSTRDDLEMLKSNWTIWK
jgi:hypothetical protein